MMNTCTNANPINPKPKKITAICRIPPMIVTAALTPIRLKLRFIPRKTDSKISNTLLTTRAKIGRASCRERGNIRIVDDLVKEKNKKKVQNDDKNTIREEE